MKQLFERARANAPVILFLDELDIIAPARSGSNDPPTDEIVGQLLQELDGIQSQEREVFPLGRRQPCRADRSCGVVAFSGAVGDSSPGFPWPGTAVVRAPPEEAAGVRYWRRISDTRQRVKGR